MHNSPGNPATRATHRWTPSRAGFTFVEVTIVALVIGIIAAIATPRMMNVASDARESATCQSLGVIRNAIDMYRAENGQLPGQSGASSGLKSDLEPYLSGPFPMAEVGNLNDNVRVKNSGDPLFGSGLHGWAYDKFTGQFIINHVDYESL